MATETIAVALPAELIEDVDRHAGDRDRFIRDAVQHELERRRRTELERSLRAPHPDSPSIEALGLADWGDGDESLLDEAHGREIRWSPGVGWEEGP